MPSDVRFNPNRGYLPLPVLSAAQMKARDKRIIRRVGISALCLMENAGRAIANEVERMLRARRRNSTQRYVCIVCGNGNNGGDGLVAARHLLNKGVSIFILEVGNRAQASVEFAVNYRVARKLKIPFCRPNLKGIRILDRAELVVDAMLGVGLSRPVAGSYRQVIDTVNHSGVPVLAVDIPSGLDATTGCVWGACVKATATVTLAYPKKGLFIGEGPLYSGRVIVADIGIPYSFFH